MYNDSLLPLKQPGLELWRWVPSVRSISPDVTKLIIAFRNFAYEPENELKSATTARLGLRKTVNGKELLSLYYSIQFVPYFINEYVFTLHYFHTVR